MMSKYIDAIEESIEKAYPAQNKDQYRSITICKIPFQKMYPPTQNYLQNFVSVTSLSITSCDLRTLQNFPFLPQLVQLDISNNGLQGSFEHIMKNRSLEYINASYNYISDEIVFLPLKKFRKMSICIANNPICSQKNCNSSYQLQHVKILKEPKKNLKNLFQKEQISLKPRNPFMRNNDEIDNLPINEFNGRQHIMMSQLKILQRLSQQMAQNQTQELNHEKQLFQFIRSRYRNRERMVSLGDNDSEDE